jgi:hypothetical protein
MSTERDDDDDEAGLGTEGDDEPDDARPDDDEPIRCWCGALGTYEELFDDSGLDDSCAGTGFVNCLCGGDSCVCHHHGETECAGCEDCDFGEGRRDGSGGHDGDEDDWREALNE